MSKEVKVLIVDDEEDILEFLSYNLEKEGYEVRVAKRAKKALKILEDWMPELVILDIMMPEIDGIELCGIIRENKDFDRTLIVFLSAKSESYTQVTALEAGADDYITKPIKPKLLRTKVKALLKRHYRFQHEEEKSEAVLKFGKLSINTEEFKVIVDKEDVALAKKEFELLMLLTSKPGKVFQREEILRKVWGKEVIVGDRTIDVHVRKLREKIGKSYIKTLKGVGYKFKY